MEAFLASRDDGRISIAETGAITFSIHLVTRSPLLRDVSAHPTVVGICADLIGPDVNLYWDQAVYKKPEKPRRFPWHQDNGYAFVEPQQYLTIWSRSPTRPSTNGCPVVAPSCHRRGHARAHVRRPARLGVPARPGGDGRRRGPGGRRGRVLVAHAAPHRAEHDRRGPQGLHPPVRTGRRDGLTGDPRGGPTDADGAMHPTASTRCSLGGGPRPFELQPAPPGPRDAANCAA